MHISKFFSKMKTLNRKKKQETPPKKHCVPHIHDTGSHCFSVANKITEIKVRQESSVLSLDICQKSGRNDYFWKPCLRVRNSLDQRLVISTAYIWNWSNDLEKFGWQSLFSQAQRHSHFIYSCFLPCMLLWYTTTLVFLHYSSLSIPQ